MTRFSEQYLEQVARRAGYSVREQSGGERVDTSTPTASHSGESRGLLPAGASRDSMPDAVGTITLPWPPSGQHAHSHVDNARYLRPHAIAYRAAVAHLCSRYRPVRGRFRLHVHLSPPDARERDMDNALKSLFDAIRHAGYIQSDSMTCMRELLVTTDDERCGNARVIAIAMEAQEP